MAFKKVTIFATQEQRNEIVVQHNHLIEARYNLTLQEKRLMFWLASRVKSTDEDFKEHELSIKEFAELVDVKGDHLYGVLNNITHKLMQKIITIRSMDEKENEIEFVKAALLGGVKYLKKKGIIKLSFHPYLKPYMLHVKERFTQIRLGDLIGLKSVHSIRFYELLKQYETIGIREIKLIDLREYCGIEEKQYERFNDFKRKVVETAKKEINSKTDLLIDYKEIKTSRKVTAIQFSIKPNPNYGKTHFEKAQADKADLITKELRSKNVLVDELMEYGFSKIAANRILKNNQESNVANAIKAVDLQVQKGKAKNPKAMLETAIKESWYPDRYRDKTTKKAC